MGHCGKAFFIILFATGIAIPSAQRPEGGMIALRAARVLNVRSGVVDADAVVLIRGDRITACGSHVPVPSGTPVLDLGDATLLPGLADVHTHMLARIGDERSAYALMLLTKSEAFRALEGAADSRLTLNAGFTAVRDAENEGSGYADVALRDAIDQGLVPGPRMLVATRGIAAVGAYQPFGISPDLDHFPAGAQLVSGADEARRAAREQLSHGADLLKVYADWHTPTLTIDEIRAVVEEAHKAGRRVAAHADSVAGIQNAVTAGVDSIEHGTFANRMSLELMQQRNVAWVPTRSVLREAEAQAPEPVRLQLARAIELGRENLTIARELHIRIASGSDASTPGEHGRNAREIVELERLGVPAVEAIQAATVIAAQVMGREQDLGALEAGKFADVIAVKGNPLTDITELERVKFVMKGGTVVLDEISTRKVQ